MRKTLFITASLFLLQHFSFAQKNKLNKLYVNAGAGPSYSLFYNSGGWVRAFGDPNFNNITQQRNAWAFSHFAELEWRLRNPKWSVRAGYSMHHFHPVFNAEGVSANNTYYQIHTKESDRYTYLQTTVHYAFLDRDVDRLELGTGFYIQKNQRQGIEYYNSFSGPGGAGAAFIIDDYKSEEAGFPLNLDYLRKLKNGNAIGCRFNFNYTQSVQTAEHLAVQLYIKAKLR